MLVLWCKRMVLLTNSYPNRGTVPTIQVLTTKGRNSDSYNINEPTISLISVALGLTIRRFSLWTLRNSAASVDSARLFTDSCLKRHKVISQMVVNMKPYKRHRHLYLPNKMCLYLNEFYYNCRYLLFHKYVLFKSPLFVLVGFLGIITLNQIKKECSSD